MQPADQVESVATVLVRQPDRVAAVWRRVRFSRHPNGQARTNLLEDAVEPFVREIGQMVAGKEGSPWSRTRAVLRLSRARGPGALRDELRVLRRCLVDTCTTLGANEHERLAVLQALAEALESAREYYGFRFEDGAPPRVPFGGPVVELYEHLPSEAPAAPASLQP